MSSNSTTTTGNTTPTTTPYYLGLSISHTHLSAVVLSNTLAPIKSESLVYDIEFQREYGTIDGALPLGSGAGDQPQIAPLEMYVRALEQVLDRLMHADVLSKVTSIGLSAFSAPVFYTAPLSLVTAATTAGGVVGAIIPSLAHQTVPLPTSLVSAQHATALLSSLGGKAKLAGKVGVMPHSGMLGPQIMRCREEIGGWDRVRSITTLAGFLRDVLCGAVAHGSMGEGDARLSAMWNVREEGWDKDVSRIVFGDESASDTFLGRVELAPSTVLPYKLAGYWISKYGFSPTQDVSIAPPLPDVLSNYLSLSPCSHTDSSSSSSPSSSSFAVMSFSASSDTVLAPLANPTTCPGPNKMCAFLPHPVPASSSKTYLAYLESHLGHQARTLVRDMYTKSWSAFDRLVAIVPSGGSIGLDNKLFAFWVLGGDSYPYIFGARNGIWRFETGAKVHEFRDLRANPRCLIEGQLVGMRVRWGRLTALGVVAGRTPSATPPQPSPAPQHLNNTLKDELGFDPYENGHLPRRLFCGGMMAACGSVVNVLTDVWDAEVWVGAGLLEELNEPSRHCLGAGYYAWYLTLLQNGPVVGSFEEEVGKVIMRERVEREKSKATSTSGGRSPRPGSVVNGGAGGGAGGGSASGSAGASGLVRTSSRSGLSAFMLHDEDDEPPPPPSQYNNNNNNPSPSIADSTPQSTFGFPPAPSSSYTTPDPNHNKYASSPDPASKYSTDATMFRPVTPLEEAPGGAVVKVAEPDHDSFMQYAALVPEYCRLEGLVVRDAV